MSSRIVPEILNTKTKTKKIIFFTLKFRYAGHNQELYEDEACR